MARDGKYEVEKFDGRNYQLWKMQVEDYMYQKDLYLPFDEKEGPTKMTDEEWKILDRKALGSIRLSLAASVALNITEVATMVELMKSLANLYEKPSASNKVYLMKKLFNSKMQEGESVSSHLNDFWSIVNQLKLVNILFDDEMKELLFLCSFPDSWENMVMVVDNATYATNILKFDDVVSIILNEEIRRKSTGELLSGNALNVKTRGRQKERSKSKNNGKSKSKNSIYKSRGKGITCWNCRKKGHVKKDCWFKENKENVPKKGKEENVASSEVMQDALILSLDNKIESWVLDSGASFHATPNKGYFKNYV
ncbi:hypothetical protein KI387_001252 [Taxus chinensis]|uniref:CCHC-type domain-containing protein n=1 Tax=Taxus chinensis TaxID=29808 RepID=A0AA38GUG7_TAXCH|nr:hypothetical protein KI387_001252 [Taxus chinensis]